MSKPRIALVHAVSVAIDPIRAAFAEDWPEAELVNLLDDSLSPDRAQDHELTDAMHGRIIALGNYVLGIGAEAVLFTCSAFGSAIEAFAEQTTVPVLKPNEAMFEQALETGGRIGMLATFAPSVAGMEQEFHEEARRRGVQAKIRTELVPEAMAALKAGDVHAHNTLLAERARVLSDCDAIMLAHFSTARAFEALASVVPCPVLTSPGAAVMKLRRALSDIQISPKGL